MIITTLFTFYSCQYHWEIHEKYFFCQTFGKYDRLAALPSVQRHLLKSSEDRLKVDAVLHSANSDEVG